MKQFSSSEKARVIIVFILIAVASVASVFAH